ncbi:MAG TPA: 30S ribosomal protein S3 [Thermodesulfobacteriota bacterium]|nr:30S ribosomal protein S3 [Deltaproteobacteria bacterium]HNR14041.1 30S ribosomal protein S3 [Thermodesulfobacteriota bacterium]HNU70643.1 30S ribosomal protein S3 [Thermodesulfobacteriota bacterium]
MGQKVHPIGFRLGINSTWRSRWFAEKEYGTTLQEDIRIRRFLKRKLYHAGISQIDIERIGAKVIISVHTARPGIIIGRKGAEIESLKSDIQQMTAQEVHINIIEVRKPEVDAQLVAENVANQLIRRVSFRRAMKRCVSSALKFGALGVKIACAGRLGGAEMARREWYREGKVPLHTIRANIDYATAEAKTTYGLIGIKVWIYKGETSKEDEESKTRVRK